MSNEHPKNRLIKRFLWKPLTIGGERRWLRRVAYVEEYFESPAKWCQSFWYPALWID